VRAGNDAGYRKRSGGEIERAGKSAVDRRKSENDLVRILVAIPSRVGPVAVVFAFAEPSPLDACPPMIDFFEFSNEMLCYADRQGTFTRVNQAWTKTLGWTAAELTSRPYIEFVHPDDVETTIREAQMLQRDTYETVRFENRYRCRDGSYRWLSWQVVPEPGSDLLICSARDVTEQKMQTLQLREAEERFRTLATYAPVGIAQADAAGSIFYVNARWCELAGVTPDETMGFAWQQFIHAEDRTAEIERWQTAMHTGHDVPPHEFRFVHRNGDMRWGSSSISMLKDAEGRIVGQIATVEDITERKNGELELRAAEERFSAFMNHNPTLVWAKDDAGEIVFLNRMCLDIFQLDEGGWRGKTDFDFWPPHVAQRLQRNDRKVLEKQEPTRFIEETVDAEGVTQYWMTILFPYRDRLGRRYVGGIAIEITEMKRTEDALKHEQDLLRNLIEVQEREKQYISYEFHDGLIQYAAGARMFLESYKRKLDFTADAELVDKAIKSLEIGIAEGRRVIRGIRPTVLDDMGVEAAIDDLVDQCAGSGLQVNARCEPGLGRLPATLEATVYRVAQEAITNARKYSRTDRIDIDLRRDGHDLRLEVRDYGVGFDVEAMRKEGFGLIGMNERVRLLGGECKITSVPNEGTTIAVRIPIPQADDDD